MGSFGGDLFAVFKSRITVIICGLLTSIITARYLGATGSGIVAALTVYPDLFMVVGSLGIRQSTAYFVGQNKFEEAEIFSALFRLWVFSSIFCIIVCYILLNYNPKGEYGNSLILLAILPIPFSLFSTYSSGVFLGKNRIKDFNSVNWIPNVIKLIVYLLFIVILPWDVFGAMLGIVLGYVGLSFFVWKKMSPMIAFPLRNKSDVIYKMLRLGIVYALALFVISLNYKINIIMLEQLSSRDQIGIYAKGVSIVEYLWEVPTLLSTIVFARSASSTDPLGFSKKVAQLLRICFIVVSLMSIAFFFLSTFIMVTMYGEEFRESSMVQKILLPGILLMTIFKVLNMDLAGKGKPWIAMLTISPALLINIILNWIWDAKYGANGAAMASTISYSISAVLFLFVYAKQVNIPLREIVFFNKADFDFIKKFKLSK